MSRKYRRFTAVHEGRTFRCSGLRDFRFCVAIRARQHTWQCLGVHKTRQRGGQWSSAFFVNTDDAEAYIKKHARLVFDGTLSNEIGNNEHLRGMTIYDQLVILPVIEESPA